MSAPWSEAGGDRSAASPASAAEGDSSAAAGSGCPADVGVASTSSISGRGACLGCFASAWAAPAAAGAASAGAPSAWSPLSDGAASAAASSSSSSSPGSITFCGPQTRRGRAFDRPRVSTQGGRCACCLWSCGRGLALTISMNRSSSVRESIRTSSPAFTRSLRSELAASICGRKALSRSSTANAS